MVAETCIHVLVNEGGGCWGVREGVRITLFSILTTVRLPSKIQKKKNFFYLLLYNNILDRNYLFSSILVEHIF